MKNNINVIVTALIGTLFGIGILSGQESLQVYLCSNDSIFLKIAITVLVMAIMSYFLLKISHDTKPKSFENIVFDNNILRIGLQTFFVITSLIGLTLMFAGGGSLFESLFGWPTIVGSVLIATIVALLGISGSKNIMIVFKYVTPFLIIITIITSLISLFISNDAPFTSTTTQVCMFPNQYVTSGIYAFYFVILLIPVLVPIGKQFSSNKSIFRDSLISSCILGTALLLITLAMSNNINLVEQQDLPMLELSKSINPILSIIYSVALISGVIVCPSAILFGMINLFETKNNKYLNNRVIVVLVLSLFALFFSRIGFGRIISLVVPTVGSMGLVISLIIIIKYYKTNKKRN